MSGNPYQPSQVDQGVSGQSIGLRRILAIAAAYRACGMRSWFDGFRWQHLLLILLPFALWAVSYKVLDLCVFQNDDQLMWLMLASMAPAYLFLFLSTLNGGVILSPRPREQTPPQDAVNSDGVLYASGVFSLKESAANYNRIFRFINRILTGRSPINRFVRVPCLIAAFSPQQVRRSNPFDDEEECEPEEEGNDRDENTEYWYATGKLDPQKEPELVYQHLGFNSEPAVKIHYIDQHQRPIWLVLASPDADYLQQTLASMPQSFMITLGS